MTHNESRSISWLQAGIAVLWPSFAVAILASGLFFSEFNPEDLILFESTQDLSQHGIYTIGFFLFWILSALSGAGTLYFAITNIR